MINTNPATNVTYRTDAMWFHQEMSSIFYVDPDYDSIGRKNSKMETTEVRTLKQELASTQEALKTATKRCRDLVRELDNRTVGHESERALRDQQLSRILRALLVLEARLKQEQKSIRQQLCEKDNVIRNQQFEIAKLRRYTKNYIKCKREQDLGKQTSGVDIIEATIIEKASFKTSATFKTEPLVQHRDSSLTKDIQNLKCEIITKLNHTDSSPVVLESLDRGIRKAHSFAGSDISKASLTSSENTDTSVITTTTEGGSPSILSTEGFCEGESTDVSPGSTLNKSSRCTPTLVTDSENETTMVFDDDDDDNDEEANMTDIGGMKSSKRKVKLTNATREATVDFVETATIKRTESKDDGMDCNFVSEDEEREHEPIYVNSCNETNSQNVPVSTTRTAAANTTISAEEIATSAINAVNVQRIIGDQRNNNDETSPKIEIDDQGVEETSGNWYSDPDEDRISDDVFRHSSYRANSNHNSVLECVNQILLRDMEEEENILSVPRKFKHRGRIVRFQPARLSDIESVGSEMERKNSEESSMDRVVNSGEFNSDEDPIGRSFEPTASEDEFGMKITCTSASHFDEIDDTTEASPTVESEEKAVPILIIEPTVDIEVSRNAPPFVANTANSRFKSTLQPISPPLKLERMEEKTCLQMSSKGLTIAKNLDYEDIESLPEVSTPPPKTPPALPPKPQFRNNTLILKKIPSPSFLIDETRKKLQLLDKKPNNGKRIFGLLSSPTNSVSTQSLNLDDSSRAASNEEETGFWKNKFNDERPPFQVKEAGESLTDQPKRVTPRVTNVVRQFEEFKIGGDSNERENEIKDRNRSRYVQHLEFEQEFDIRQNFEEFNLDECDLSDDPDRPEGDGSERLGDLGNVIGQNENAANDNINVILPTSNSTNNGYDHFLEATGLSNKSILTPSRLLSNHKSMLKPKDIKYKSKIKATGVTEKHGASTATTTHVRHWTGPFV